MHSHEGDAEAVLTKFSYLTKAFVRALDDAHAGHNTTSLVNTDTAEEGEDNNSERRKMIEDCLRTLQATQRDKADFIHPYDEHHVKLKTLHKEYGIFRGNWAVHVAQHGALSTTAASSSSPYSNATEEAKRTDELLRPAVIDAVTSELLIRSLTRGREELSNSSTQERHEGWYYTDLRSNEEQEGEQHSYGTITAAQQQGGGSTLCDKPSKISFTVDLHPCPNTAVLCEGNARANSITTSITETGDVKPELESLAVASLNAQLHRVPNPLRDFLRVAIVNKAGINNNSNDSNAAGEVPLED